MNDALLAIFFRGCSPAKGVSFSKKAADKGENVPKITQSLLSAIGDWGNILWARANASATRNVSGNVIFIAFLCRFRLWWLEYAPISTQSCKLAENIPVKPEYATGIFKKARTSRPEFYGNEFQCVLPVEGEHCTGRLLWNIMFS